MRYKFLEHTADAKFRAYGKNLGEAFSNAALAMFSIITHTEKIEPNKTKKVDVTAPDLESLLYKWLEELLFLLDTENFFLHDVKTIKIRQDKKYYLEATIVGDRFKEEYKILGSVKAVTYNDMFVKKNRVVTVQVVVDM